MLFREAHISDIERLHSIRLAVKENMLTNPHLVTERHYKDLLSSDGKGWVCEVDGQIHGFAIIDTQKENVWALFVHPFYEKSGIGKRLHHIMLDWYFNQGKDRIWLSTSANTRAEKFYRKAGWQAVGFYEDDELKFEMRKERWEQYKHT